ncbi:MAG: alpha/beta hydrolase [Rubricoccaceae bacterium]
MNAHALAAVKTARYYTLGPADGPLEGVGAAVWVACHGYGQLARFFLRHFRVAETPGRLVVAPEALSRFYLDGDGPGGPGRYERVAACWMTRDDREADIADNVRYLDDVLVAACARAGADPLAIPLVGFGFSQGAATVARWGARSPLLARRARRLHRLVLWGATLPPDLDPGAHRAWLGEAGLTLVAGDADPYATPARVAAETRRLAAAGLRARVVSYSGGHRLHAETLRRLAAGFLPAETP